MASGSDSKRPLDADDPWDEGTWDDVPWDGDSAGDIPGVGFLRDEFGHIVVNKDGNPVSVSSGGIPPDETEG